MKSTQSKDSPKNQQFFNTPLKQSSFSFLGQCNRIKPINTTIDTFQLNRLKKSYKKQLNLHQIKIEVDCLCQQKDKDDQNQSHIINQLKQKDIQYSHLERMKSQKSQHFKRQLKIWSQNKKNNQDQIRQNCNSLFNQGFLPDVKNFYNTYKNFERQNQKAEFLRNSLPGNFSRTNSFKTLKLTQKIKEQDLPPRNLGLFGSISLDKLNQNSCHLTKKQYKTLAKGISFVDLHKISLANNKLSKQNAKLLMKNLPQKVQKINLKNTIQSKDILFLLNSQTMKQGKLKKLNLSYNKITDTGLKCIEQVFNHNLTLQILNLSNNFITDKSSDILSLFIKKNQNLRNLNLAWNQFTGREIYKIFDAIEFSRSLLNLNFTRNIIGNQLSEIILNLQKTKDILQEQHQHMKNYSSLRSLCNLIRNNRYLLHFDLSFNKIQSKDCESLAQSFNFFNQTLIGLHFLGNSTYFQNQFGFLVNYDENLLINTYQGKQDPFRNQKISQFQKNIFDLKQEQKNGLKDQTDKCWLCLGWISQKFTFQIDKKMVQILQAFKNPFSNKQFPTEVIKNVYLHLQCYDYQPVLMKCKKKIKGNIISKILQGQRSFQNFHSQKQRSKSPFSSKKNLQQNQKVKQSANTSKNLTNLQKSQKSFNDNDQEIIIYSYSINLKIPTNKKLRYFFTIDGQPITDKKSEIQKINCQQVQIVFSIFNPFQSILSKLLQDKVSKQIINDQTKQIIKLLFTSIVKNEGKHNLSRQRLFLDQFNLHIPDIQSHKEQQNTYLEKHLLSQVYKKLLSDNQQLTQQEYNLLIKQRVKFQQTKNQGSDKYISSNKLIQTKKLQLYEDQVQGSSLYVKPRCKEIFIGQSDPKLNQFNFSQFFKTFLCFNEQPKNQRLSQKFQKLVQKAKDIQKQTELQIFYPFKLEKNAKNDFLNMVHFLNLVHKSKIKIDSFTGKIIKIGYFDDKDQVNQNSNKNQINDEQKQAIIDQQSVKKLSNIMPYVLISYQNSKRNESDLILTLQNSGVQNKLEQKSSRKNRQKSKISQTKLSSSKISETKKLQITTQDFQLFEQQIKQKQQNENENIISAKQRQSGITLKYNGNQQKQKINLDLLNQDQAVNIISMRLVQQILGYKKQQTDKKISNKKNQLTKANQKNFNKFVQKLLIIKIKQTQYNNQQKQLLSTVNQQIKQQLQERIKKIQQIHKLSSKKSNKFNLKINKFCSLETNTPGSVGFKSNFIKAKSKKRPTADFKDNYQKIIINQFQNPFQKQQENPNLKNNIASQNMKFINIMESTKFFFLYDKIFHKIFVQQSVYNKVEFYSKKIDKFLGKKQRKISIKRQSKTSLVQGKRADKDKKLKRIIGKSSQKIQKIKIISTNSTKNSILSKKNQQNENDFSLQMTENNIFLFLVKQKQISTKYFCNEDYVRYSFQQNQTQTNNYSVNQNDYILRRFDYIVLNLINNLNKIKEFKCSLSIESKQILLQQLLIYRSFLLNSKKISFHRNFQRLAEIKQDLFKHDNQLQLKFIQKMQIVNFNGILDLMHEYLLYVIFFITKQICFLIMSNANTQKILCQNQNTIEKSKIKIKIIQKDKKQIIAEKDEFSQDSESEEKQKVNNKNQPKQMSLIQFISNQPQKFQLKLKNLMQSVSQDVILIITKLHVKFDKDLRKFKQDKIKQQILQQNYENQQNSKSSFNDAGIARKNSIFSKNSQKNLSKEKEKSSRSKKKKNNQPQKDKSNENQKQITEIKSNLISIKEKKPKSQKNKPKLSLNQGKKQN